MTKFWENFILLMEELHRCGFVFPMNNYPFVIFIDPEWVSMKLLSDSDDVSKQK